MAKNTHAQEVATGTAESFTEHELSDPMDHLALLRNRPTLGDVDKPAPVLEEPPVVEPDEVQETKSEIEEFQAELDEIEPEELEEEDEEPEPEPKPAPRKAARKTTSRRQATDDFE